MMSHMNTGNLKQYTLIVFMHLGQRFKLASLACLTTGRPCLASAPQRLSHHTLSGFVFTAILFAYYFGSAGTSVLRGLSLGAVSRAYTRVAVQAFSLSWLLLLQSTGSGAVTRAREL